MQIESNSVEVYARENNLKNIDVVIPRDRLTVCVGGNLNDFFNFFENFFCISKNFP